MGRRGDSGRGDRFRRHLGLDDRDGRFVVPGTGIGLGLGAQ
jgi:hypothetical protein